MAERYFRVEFAPGVAASGRRILWGHVYNSYYRGARNVSLLVEGLDEVAAPTPGTTFRVSVLDFD